LIKNVPLLKAVELYSDDFPQHLDNLRGYYSKQGWGWGYSQLVEFLVGYLKTKNKEFALAGIRRKFHNKEKLSSYLERAEEFISLFSKIDVTDSAIFKHEPLICYQTRVQFPDFIKYKSEGKAHIILPQFNKTSLLSQSDIDLLFSIVKFHVLNTTETEFLEFSFLRFEDGIGELIRFSEVEVLGREQVRNVLVDIGNAYAQTERSRPASRIEKKPTDVVHPDLFEGLSG